MVSPLMKMVSLLIIVLLMLVCFKMTISRLVICPASKLILHACFCDLGFMIQLFIDVVPICFNFLSFM